MQRIEGARKDQRPRRRRRPLVVAAHRPTRRREQVADGGAGRGRRPVDPLVRSHHLRGQRGEAAGHPGSGGQELLDRERRGHRLLLVTRPGILPQDDVRRARGIHRLHRDMDTMLPLLRPPRPQARRHGQSKRLVGRRADRTGPLPGGNRQASRGASGAVAFLRTAEQPIDGLPRGGDDALEHHAAGTGFGHEVRDRPRPAPRGHDHPAPAGGFERGDEALGIGKVHDRLWGPTGTRRSDQFKQCRLMLARLPGLMPLAKRNPAPPRDTDVPAGRPASGPMD